MACNARPATTSGSSRGKPDSRDQRMDRSFIRRSSRLAFALLAALGAAACARPPVAELYPQVEEYAGREIADVDFVNPAPFSTDSLERITETEATRCRFLGFLPFCFPGTGWGRQERHLDLRQLGEDLRQLQLLYRTSGYFGTQVVPDVQEIAGDGGPVRVTFQVHRGDPVILDSLFVEGTEGIADPDSLREHLPLQPGDLLHLREFVASADTVLRALRRRGHAYAEVLRNYSVDTIQDRATAWLVAVPGPRVVVDSIILRGDLENLSRTTTLRQVTFAQGDLLRRSRLLESQRNLYDMDLVQFVAVEIAPDTLQLTPEDSTTATVIVEISEAPEHVVEAAAGFGTVECFRTSGRWTDRSFRGGARRLTVTASLSRIGIGGPTDYVGSDLCTAGRDTFATELDYRLTGELAQPYFLGPNNQIGVLAFVERQSEPRLYQRTARGARIDLSRRLGLREALTATLDLEHRQTRAVPALYCFAFLVCDPEDIEELGQWRWRNAVGVSWVRDRSDNVVEPSDGYVARSAAVWATPLLGSSFDFVRSSGEGSLYRRIRRGWIAAGHVRLGSFLTHGNLGGDDFVAPEERFYAGGASSVRGFGRNELGPGSYVFSGPPDTPLDSIGDVDFVPSGGTSVGVVSAELRFPSPVLREHLRLGAFVDAGTVGLQPIWDLESQWRVTPGVGLRIRTPVGPARVDFAFNPYPHPRAPLYAADPETRTLHRIMDGYRPAPPDFLQRLRIHVAVGHAF